MDKSGVTLERLRTFVRVADRGSLSAVARELGVGQSTITRQLQELEDAVGVPLLSRTTRRVTVTDEGSRYYANALQILRLVEQAGDEARATQGAAAGTIRISCTAGFGILHVTKMIFAFQDLYPHISVDLDLTDARIDLVREGVDIAVRLAPLIDSTLKLRALGESQRILVASPAYLAEHGKPACPQDLSAHENIRMSNVMGSETLVLRGADGVDHAVPVTGRFRVNHGLAVREALVAGRGIAAAHRWLIDDLLAEGQLEAILPDYRLPGVPLNMLIVPERAGIARVRLLMDFIAARIAALPGIQTSAMGRIDRS
ncbi:LysR family transcriptional regulator [Roseixanthobacter glucoisosaccharinicivorans]|uniref:LysR family transcriptional regulator n=1 Tax=Roseixanthobacter glucoisosaccharinicivorans TaxID=3119923 RepID=UPI0037285FE0